MNLNDERNYQMRQEMRQAVLDAMCLSEENRRLADGYLDIELPEDQSLLEKVTHQDFSQLNQEAMKKCTDYVEHLEKRSLTEELVRYVRFCGEVGGSTARYILFTPYAVSLSVAPGPKIKEIMTPEQAAAIQAELFLWTRNITLGILRGMIESCREQPEVYRKAMEYCYQQESKARILLAGIYLYVRKPSRSEKGMNEDTEGVSAVVSILTDCLVSSAPNIFEDKQKLTDHDKKVLRDFLSDASEDAPFTGEIQSVLQKAGPASRQMICLLARAAFMAMEHSDRFLLFVRFAMYVNLQETLDTCININMQDLEWFLNNIELLEQALPVKLEDYGRWFVANHIAQPLQRMAKNNQDAVKQMIPSLSTDGYQFLMDRIAETDTSLYQELSASYNEEFRYRMASELTQSYQTGKAEARDYLLGIAEIEQLYPFTDNWQENRARFTMGPDFNKKMAQMRDGKDVPMFHRAVVLEALSCRPYYLNSNRILPESRGASIYNYANVIDRKQIGAILDILEQEKVPAVYQLKLMEAIYDNYYQDSHKSSFMSECVNALGFKKTELSSELTAQAQSGSATIRLMCIQTLDIYWREFKELLLSCASDSSKQVREFLVTAYASHKEWEPEMLSMLSSKKSQERELAIQVLGKWGTAAYREQLEKALETEKSKKLKDQITALLGIKIVTDHQDQSGQTGQPAAKTADQLAAELLKGGRKRKVEWTSEAFVSSVHKLDGTEASTEYIQALLVAYADMRTPGVSQDAARLAAELNRKELADFMGLLFDKWVDTGAEAKKKWVLYAVSIHGGDAIVPTLHHQIQVWPEAARGAIAAEAVRALALNGSSTALLLVDQIARKFKNRQVKAAAGEALSYAAEQLGITRMELEDRIVPSLDFDEKMERHFDYGTRSFRVKLTPTLELEIFDESGKKLKNMPSPGKQDDEEKAKASSEAFKLMKKQLKTVVTNQKLRLEQALSAERLWPADKWQELFVKNPIMHQFAIGLIWGVYTREEPETQGQEPETQGHAQNASAQMSKDSKPTSSGHPKQAGSRMAHTMKTFDFHSSKTESNSQASEGSSRGITLTDTFRYMEDGSFNTVDEEEYELPENAQIGLVHPVELSAETLAAWKEQLSDYEVTQPFEQLERPVYLVTEEEKTQKELSRFGGVVLNGLSLSGKLLGQGWYRGATWDGGAFYTYYRNDGANGVELEFSGSPIGYEGEDVTVYGIYFYPSGEAAQGSYRYHKGYEKQRCFLSDVSPRYFSEIVLLVTRATASSQEKLAYPECKDNRY